MAALIGDPARANMLAALMAGRALTAGELAREAGVGLPTASAHLARLRDGGLVGERKQGRHKYISLASPDVARALEALMGLAAGAGHLRTQPGPKDQALRKARVCYNHLAGDMGIRLYDSLVARGFLEIGRAGLDLTPAGEHFAGAFGVDLTGLRSARAPLCRECLDWSERRSHLAGSLGRAFLSGIVERGWAARDAGSRVVRFSRQGEAAFAEAFPHESS
jgi:DNA-binding transcriptional ArsR family regulator